MNKLLAHMSPATKSQLESDLAAYGPHLKTRAALMAAGLPKKRAERVVAARDESSRATLAVQEDEQTPQPSEAVHMVIPDCHAKHGVDLSFFAALGRMERDIQPTRLIQLGDWYDLPSMFDGRGQTAIERNKTRLKDDLDAGRAALDLYMEGTGGARTERHFCVGNHDARVFRIGEREPWMEGLFDPSSAHEEAGWVIHDFLKPARLDGVRYQHYLCREGTDKAISGKNHARALLERVKHAESVVVGHSHRYDHRIETLTTGRRVHGVVAGCAFLHEEDYAGEDDNAGWHRGVLVLHDVRDGDFDIEVWSMRRILKRWG